MVRKWIPEASEHPEKARKKPSKIRFDFRNSFFKVSGAKGNSSDQPPSSKKHTIQKDFRAEGHRTQPTQRNWITKVRCESEVRERSEVMC